MVESCRPTLEKPNAYRRNMAGGCRRQVVVGCSVEAVEFFPRLLYRHSERRNSIVAARDYFRRPK